MQVGLVTPPGLLGDFVERAVKPAGHQLTIAPDLHALVEQRVPDVVLLAPVIAGAPAERALGLAAGLGLRSEQLIYLGLDPGVMLEEFAASCLRANGSAAGCLRQVPAAPGMTVLIPAGIEQSLIDTVCSTTELGDVRMRHGHDVCGSR